jgi:PIN domain
MSLHLLHHVFVDYENVHQCVLSEVGSTTVMYTILMGAKQTKLDAALVEKLLAQAESVQLVRLTASGKNALDFTLAYYVGRAAIVHPGAQFHIISRDTGFDALIAHLQSRRINAQRHSDFQTLPFAEPPTAGSPYGVVRSAPAALLSPKPPKPPKSIAPSAPPKSEGKPRERSLSAAEIKDYVVDHLQTRTSNRPSRLKSLEAYLQGICGKKYPVLDLPGLIKSLCEEGHISLDERGSITYPLSNDFDEEAGEIPF